MLTEGKGGGGGGEDEEEKKVEWRCVRKTRIPTQRMWGQTEIVNTNLDDVSPSPMRVQDSHPSANFDMSWGPKRGRHNHWHTRLGGGRGQELKGGAQGWACATGRPPRGLPKQGGASLQEASKRPA